jgi:hypothetical protein
MDNNTRTIYGAYLQTCALLGLNVDIKANTTLNQKLALFENEIFIAKEYPTIKYVTIGNGGHNASIGANGIPLINPIPHSPRHSGLYNQIPFLIREIGNDITPSERLKYRLRVIRVFDTVSYICYFGRALDLTDIEAKIELRNNTNGVITSSLFTPLLSDLNPVRPVIPANGNISSTGDYIATTAQIKFTMESNEIDELTNACNIIYGDEAYAFISEIGLCTGVDRSLMGNFNGVQISYTEAIGVQIVNFINTAVPVYALNNTFEFITDVGAVEGLLNI